MLIALDADGLPAADVGPRHREATVWPRQGRERLLATLRSGRSSIFMLGAAEAAPGLFLREYLTPTPSPP